MIRCSACILTYNNEKTLEKCLESVKDFSDIVILDGGSTDATIDIAKKYNARIHSQHEDGSRGKITDFTAVRTRLFGLGEEDWVLWLDSDEYLGKETIDIIKEITENTGANKDNLYTLSRKAVINNKIIKHAFFYPEPCKRLWHKDANIKLKARKNVHEDMFPGEGMKIKNLDASLYHYWLESYGDLTDKDEYYLGLAVEGWNGKSVAKKVRKAIINILKALKIFLKSFWIYLRHGFKDTPPIIHSWRFVRYHLLLAKRVLFN